MESNGRGSYGSNVMVKGKVLEVMAAEGQRCRRGEAWVAATAPSMGMPLWPWRAEHVFGISILPRMIWGQKPEPNIKGVDCRERGKR